MPFEEQVRSIFSAINRFLDTIAVENVQLKIFWFRCGYRLIVIAAEDEESARAYVQQEFKNNRRLDLEPVATSKLSGDAPATIAVVNAPQAEVADSSGILQIIPYVAP